MEQNPICPNCSSKSITKKGKRKSKFQTIQKYKCKDCSKIFTIRGLKHKSYPAKIILNAISMYSLGNTLEASARLINSRFKTNIAAKNVQLWVDEFKEQLPYFKIREECKKLFSPKNMIFSKTFYHIQPYTFKYHKAKLHLLFHSIKYNNEFRNNSKYYEPTKHYLEKIPTEKFPYHIFKSYETKIKEGVIKPQIKSPETDIAQSNDNNLIGKNILEQRASQLKLKMLPIIKKQKDNFANKLARLALLTASSNKDRHSAIQNFFLTNDSTTIAVEVPVYLTHDDLKYYHKRGIAKNIIPISNINQSIKKKNDSETVSFSFNLNSTKNNATSASGPSPTISLKENVNKTSTTNLPSSDAEIEKIKDNDKNNLQSSDAVIAQIKNNDKNIEITKDNLNNKNKLLIKTPITGHIDILQIRNGLIHILDYKPDAHLKQVQEQAIQQLTIYALALASRTKLALSDFKCSFFDENNYYEFFPLHCVYSKN